MTDAGTIKPRISISEVVGRYVPLKRRGGEHWGLCPFHDERTPSFSVNNAKGVFNCFGCGASGNIFSFIQNIENVDFINAKKILGAHPGAGRIVEFKSTPPVKYNKFNLERARKIWEASSPINKTPGEAYLRSRGVTIPAPPTIRYHPNLKHPPTGLDLPALVVAVSDETHKIKAVQRIYLRTNGHGKAQVNNSKLSLGSIKGGAVRLSPIRETLVLTEGIEDALSILQQKSNFAVWAVLGAWNLTGQNIPTSVKRLIIGADNDEIGREAAQKAAQQYAKERKQPVEIAYPEKEFKDFNEMLLSERKSI